MQEDVLRDVLTMVHSDNRSSENSRLELSPVNCFGLDYRLRLTGICAQQLHKGSYEGNCQFHIGKQARDGAQAWRVTSGFAGFHPVFKGVL